jgi:hypothetical protein
VQQRRIAILSITVNRASPAVSAHPPLGSRWQVPFDKVLNRRGESRPEQAPRKVKGRSSHLRRVGTLRYSGNDIFPEMILIGSTLKKERDLIKMGEPQIVPQQVPNACRGCRAAYLHDTEWGPRSNRATGNKTLPDLVKVWIGTVQNRGPIIEMKLDPRGMAGS